MRLILLIAFIFNLNFLNAQTKKIILRPTEQYVCKAFIVSELASEEITCGNIDFKNYKLYKIKIDTLNYSSDSTVYSENDFSKLSYFYIYSKKRLKTNNYYYLILSNSTRKDRLFLSRIIKHFYNVYEYKDMGHIIGIIQCY